MSRRRPLHPSPRSALRAAGLLAIVVAGACAGDAGDHADDQGPAVRVVASIFPLADLVRAVGGDAVEVDVLLPPRASPGTFEANPRLIETVSRADLHVVMGGGLDAWATSLIEGASDADVLVVTRSMELVGRSRSPGSGNPHVWLDPIRTRDDVVPRIVEALARAAPGDSAEFRSRGAALADTLTALDREIDASLDPVRSVPFVTTHPAWIYYVDRYGLTEVGSIHGHPGQQPSARALAELVRASRRTGVSVVFSEPQISGTAARALARELDVPVRTLDPLGGAGLRGRDSYPALLRHNTARIVRALEGDRA